MKPPHPMAVWLSHHIKLIWVVIAIEDIVVFIVVLMVGDLKKSWVYILAAALLGVYLITMFMVTRMLRGVKADADDWATRLDSN